MIAMQYKIMLPDGYNMNIIRQRVADNGIKTDGFQDLRFKAYLIRVKNRGQKGSNEYAPLYLWKDSGGMNQFIFDGFYDNILNSFGWQRINIGIPMICDLNEDFERSKFVIEVEKDILPTQKMKPMQLSLSTEMCTGKVLIYNPDKWSYVEYYFYEKLRESLPEEKIYEILHLSM